MFSVFNFLNPQSSSLNPNTAGLLKYGGTYPGAYLLKRGLFMPWELPQSLDPEIVREGMRRLQPVKHIQQLIQPDPGAPFRRIAALESSFYMRNQLLRDADWASMAHSLEIRTPLVDATNGEECKSVLGATPRPPLPDKILYRKLDEKSKEYC